jgi:hypothetical protein
MYESASQQILRSVAGLEAAGEDPQLVLTFFEIGAENAALALGDGSGYELMLGLRNMWSAQLIAEAFLLYLEPAAN